MSKQKQQEIRDFFSKTLKFSDKNDYYEHSVSALAFSYILSMDPSECVYMNVEPDWTTEQIDEYEEVESFIYRLLKEIEFD